MIDPNEAPEGYVAVAPVEEDSCEGCAFLCRLADCTSEHDESCFGRNRKDREQVIFIKREEALKPAALTPGQVREILFDTFDNLHRLRDEFAGRALSAMRLYNLTDVELLEASEGAYWLADAMLAAKFASMTWGQK